MRPILGLLLLAAACGEPAPAVTERRSLPVAEVLGGAADPGFARAETPRSFQFPADHGPHPEFRNEWWYLTGNLRTADGRRFGYQFTIFRTALRPQQPARSSAWAATQVFMAHLAVGDVTGGQFRAFDRFARGALGLAGARPEPLRVWLEDWELAAISEADSPSAAPGLPPLRLRAREGDVALDLELVADKPIVLQGDAGLSRKGTSPGNASYYYSATRLRSEGTVQIGDDHFAVIGGSWLDREWSTSALEPEQEGWDWFSLQLGDGSELMLYLMRLRGGGFDATSAGTLVAPDGSAVSLSAADFVVEVLDTWSAADGVQYPASWRLRVPAADLDLQVRPTIADQELRLAFRYWEGAVNVEGSRGSTTLRGEGFVELTGYADR